jgi:small-conductance mechanosensitive channel
VIQWLIDNWLKVAIPVVAFLATYVVGLWLRRVVDNALERWRAKTKWAGSRLVMTTVRRPFLFWFLLLGVAIAVQVSVLPPEAKSITARVAGSLFVLSLWWTIIFLSERLLKMYLPRLKVSQPNTTPAVNVVRIIIIVVCALIVLDIWGMPTTPLLLLIVVAILAAALALRNAAPNLFAGLQLSATQQIKVGDYIKLETGEEGYVAEINWSNTRIKALDESIVVVPNSQLLQHKVINYGHPLKKAREPFCFYSRTHLTELTGLKAKNLHELVDVLKKASDAVIYYHTHRFLEEHHYLTPEPSNDFAVWVSDALGEEVLGERLTSVNTFEFPNLGALRERLAGIIEERLAKGSDSREVMTGREFHFMKSVSVVLPTPYAVHDLREFVETLRKISVGSLYFHVFESRLRLGKGLNDFSIWMKDSLGEDQLGDEVARLDPYTYTLEGLRLALIQLIEKRIK